MAAESSVIDAISAAVTASPGNTQLRLHLAELLLQSNRAAEALQHCQAVLDAEPDSLSALPLAARAAEALGDGEKATRFTRVMNALSRGNESEGRDAAPPSNVVPLRVVEGGLSEGAWTAETTKLKLADVAGMEQVKRRLNLAFLAPLRNPEMMKM
jgi:hypothetical protein